MTGENALRWDFVPGDVLTIKGKIGYKPQSVVKEIEIQGEKYPQTDEPVHFNFPVYSETSQESSLRVQFGTVDKVDCFIDILLGFEGWRKFSAAYDRGHMRGEPKEGMDFMRIDIKGDQSGTIYLDNLVFACQEDPRQTGANPLIPSQKIHPQRLGSGVSHDQEEAFRVIENCMSELEWGGLVKL